MFTDSTADLTEELREKYDIPFVPLYVNLKDKTYRDQIDIDTEKLYDLVEYHDELPKTSAPSVEDFINAFSPWVKKGYKILFLSVSSEISATYQTAILASKEFKEGFVNIIDTRNLSMGIGLLAIRTAEMIDEGNSLPEIIENINNLIPKIRTSFIIDNLKYLHMGGRCSSIEMIAGSILNIRPQIYVEDGSLIVLEKYKGNKSKTIEKFHRNFLKSDSKPNKKRIIVGHSADKEYANKLVDLIEDEYEFEEVLLMEAGTVISSHCGAGTVGIIYLEDEN